MGGNSAGSAGARGRWASGPDRAGNFPAAVFLGLGILLASCGGGDGGSTATPQAPPTAPQVPPAAPQAPPGTGSLSITVTDLDGVPLERARLSIFDALEGKLLQEQNTDPRGRVTFTDLPGKITGYIDHPLGSHQKLDLNVRQSGSTELSVVISPQPGRPVALFPAKVPLDSLSADRTELEVHMTLAGSRRIAYPWDLGEAKVPDLEAPLPGEILQWGPVMRFADCAFQPKAWQTRPGASPACYRKTFDGEATKVDLPYAVTEVRYSYAPAGVPSPAPAQEGYSVFMLMDQGRRVLSSTPDDIPLPYLRTFAATHFIRDVLGTSQPNQVALAGFAGTGGNAESPPLLPEIPLWETAFSMDRHVLEGAVNSLKSRFGGSAPVFTALQSALSRLAAQVPPNSRRAVVAFLGGGDDNCRKQPASRRCSSLRSALSSATVPTVSLHHPMTRVTWRSFPRRCARP
jgi:hypothetical protein